MHALIRHRRACPAGALFANQNPGANVPSLATAYYLKEDLGQIWEQVGKFPAKMKLLDWYH